LPQLSIAWPHAQPSPAQVVAVGVQVGCWGASHWNAVFNPQNSPVGQLPQLNVFSAAVPQPS
jgi:hypothetical protein